MGASGTAYDSAGNYSNVGLSYYTVNPTNITSTKWLVGVYNPVFGAGGDARDDGFKLASLKTSTDIRRRIPMYRFRALWSCCWPAWLHCALAGHQRRRSPSSHFAEPLLEKRNF